MEPRFAVAHLGLAYLPYARRSKLFAEAYDDEVPSEWKSKLEEADREFRHAFMIDPLVDLRIIGAVTPSSPDFVGITKAWGEEWGLYLQGYVDCQEGKYEDCNGRFAAFIKSIDGDHYDDRVPDAVFWYKGLAAAHIGKFDDAIASFPHADESGLDPCQGAREEGIRSAAFTADQRVRYTLATIYQAAGKRSEPRHLYQEAVADDIGLYMAHVQLAGLPKMDVTSRPRSRAAPRGGRQSRRSRACSPTWG